MTPRIIAVYKAQRTMGNRDILSYKKGTDRVLEENYIQRLLDGAGKNHQQLLTNPLSLEDVNSSLSTTDSSTRQKKSEKKIRILE